MLSPLTTQLVGSYTKPEWLARHNHLESLDGSWWRPEQAFLSMAREDVARLAIYEQERAGLDLLTDGEGQRQMYSSHVYTRLKGVDVHHLAVKNQGSEVTTVRWKAEKLTEGRQIPRTVPRIVDDIRWPGPLCLDEKSSHKW